MFEAWTKAEHVAKWFTPRPLTAHGCEVDFRRGGAFRITMRMPDGVEFPFNATFREIVPLEKIVFVGKIHDENDSVTAVTFAEDGARTTMTVHQTYAFESDATRGAPVGWRTTLDQLSELVALL